MTEKKQLLLFRNEGKLLATDIENVIRVLKAVFITPLPDAPQHLRGIIRYGEEVLPVIDVSVKLGGAKKKVDLSDNIILIKNSRGKFALLVDEVEGITTAGELTGDEKTFSKGDLIKGVAVSGEELVFLGDSEKFFIESDRILVDEAAEKVTVRL